MRSWRGFVVFAATLGAFLTGYAADRWRHIDVPPHWPVRTLAIQAQAAQLQKSDWLLLGDSIVELAAVPSLCGESVLNAGLASAGVAEVAGVLSGLGSFRAKHVLIAVGVNNATRTSGMGAVEFANTYRELISSAKSISTDVYVAVIAPVAKGMPAGDKHFDTAKIAEFNAFIRHVSGVRLVDFAVLAGQDGFLPAAWTVDGVHFTPPGYAAWHSVIEKAACD